MNNQKMPCDFDHNGECLICDCWPQHCAYQRLLNHDYSFESKERLELMFKDYLSENKPNEQIQNR